jgi:hypothetical protein
MAVDVTILPKIWNGVLHLKIWLTVFVFLGDILRKGRTMVATNSLNLTFVESGCSTAKGKQDLKSLDISTSLRRTSD